MARSGQLKIWTACFRNAVLSLFVAIVTGFMPAHAGYFDTEDDAQGLTDDQRALADRFLDFVLDIDETYFALVDEINGQSTPEIREFNSEASDYELKVVRGSVIEKTGRMMAITKKATSRIQTPLKWSRFYSFDVHPKTPLVGMLHAAIVLQYYEDGSHALGGWIGVMPGTRVEEDIAFLKKTTEDIFAKHSRDISYHRKLLCEHDPLVVDHSKRRQPACAGASFYGRSMMSATDENLDFITEAFAEFVAGYMSIVEKRKDDPYTEADIAAQDVMRRRWLEDQLFADPYSSSIVPYEVWAFQNMPLVIKF